jgi:hypothetical protein
LFTPLPPTKFQITLPGCARAESPSLDVMEGQV